MAGVATVNKISCPSACLCPACSKMFQGGALHWERLVDHMQCGRRITIHTGSHRSKGSAAADMESTSCVCVCVFVCPCILLYMDTLVLGFRTLNMHVLIRAWIVKVSY